MIYRVAKIAIAFFFNVLFASTSIYAQNPSGQMVDIKIYFHYDKAHIDPTYMGNQQCLHLVDSLLSDSLYISTLSRIEVSAQSSPEGAVGYNEQLSERRRLSLKEYFTTNYPQIDPTLWSFSAIAENWDLFHQHLQDDLNLPNRERVLSISASDRSADAKEWLLKTMNDGEEWLYIAENILPSHRFGASVLFIPLLPSIVESSTAVTPKPVIEPLEPQQYSPIVQQQQQAKLLFALKTNLVLDVVSVVNIAAEIPIAERWSVVGEVVYPWWRNWPANFTMQIESYHAEVKYWLGDRSTKDQLQGWSVGLYGGFGLYDIQPFSEEGTSGALVTGTGSYLAINCTIKHTGAEVNIVEGIVFVPFSTTGITYESGDDAANEWKPGYKVTYNLHFGGGYTDPTPGETPEIPTPGETPDPDDLVPTLRAITYTVSVDAWETAYAGSSIALN